METVLAFAAILGAAYFVIIISAAFVTALKKNPRHPQLQLILLKWLKSNTGETIET